MVCIVVFVLLGVCLFGWLLLFCVCSVGLGLVVLLLVGLAVSWFVSCLASLFGVFVDLGLGFVLLLCVYWCLIVWVLLCIAVVCCFCDFDGLFCCVCCVILVVVLLIVCYGGVVVYA